MENTFDSSITEKRDHPRVEKLYLISYLNKEEGRQISPILLGRTLDVSASGTRIEVFQKVNIDSELELQIIKKDALFIVTGSVLRVTKISDKDFIIGVNFSEVQNELADSL